MGAFGPGIRRGFGDAFCLVSDRAKDVSRRVRAVGPHGISARYKISLLGANFQPFCRWRGKRGPNMKTIVIAEIGENHYGNWTLCRALVEQVAGHGGTFAKFQTYKAEEFGLDHAWYDEFKKVEMPTDVHFEMQRLCRDLDVGFLSSAFTLGSARFLIDNMGVDKLKLASSRVTDDKLLDYVNGRADQVRTVFLSTGMAELDEVRAAVDRLAAVEKLYVLQCTSQYPTEDDSVNLRAMQTLCDAFPEHGVGFSDHSRGIEAVLAAVAMGAEVIEKHFTFHTAMPGDDHEGAFTPETLEEFTRRVARLETLMGTAEKAPVTAEKQSVANLRVAMEEVDTWPQ